MFDPYSHLSIRFWPFVFVIHIRLTRKLIEAGKLLELPVARSGPPWAGSPMAFPPSSCSSPGIRQVQRRKPAFPSGRGFLGRGEACLFIHFRFCWPWRPAVVWGAGAPYYSFLLHPIHICFLAIGHQILSLHQVISCISKTSVTWRWTD